MARHPLQYRNSGCSTPQRLGENPCASVTSGKTAVGKQPTLGEQVSKAELVLSTRLLKLAEIVPAVVLIGLCRIGVLLALQPEAEPINRTSLRNKPSSGVGKRMAAGIYDDKVDGLV